MATWDDVRALGYAVERSAEGVVFVSGCGLGTYIKEDDQAQIDSLADPVLHAKRIAPPEPTVTPTPVVFVVPQLAKTATLADVIAAVNALTASS